MRERERATNGLQPSSHGAGLSADNQKRNECCILLAAAGSIRPCHINGAAVK